MKRTFSVIMLMIHLLSMLSVAAYADSGNDVQNEVIALACEVFPEYANKILAPAVDISIYGRSMNQRTLVVSETRSVSDNEYITYSEYSDGVVLLTDYEFEHTETTNDYDSNPMTTTVDMDIKATCTNVSGYFLLEGVRYMLINGSYDTILDVGTPTYSGKCTLHTAFTPVLNESASGNAYICYNLNYQFGPGVYYTLTSQLTLFVGDDTATVTHIYYT